MAQFYIARPPDHLGCFSLDEVVEKLHSGEFRTDDLAFKEGFPDWKQISEIPELMDKLGDRSEFGGGKVSDLLEAKELEGPERVHKMEDPDILEVRAVKKTGFAYKRDWDLKPSEEIEFSKLASLKEVTGEVEPVEPSAPSLPAAPDPAPGGVPAAPPAPGIALDESYEPLPKQKCVAPALPAPLPPPLATASAAPVPAAPPAPIPVPASGVPVAQDPAAVIAPVPAAAPVLHEIPAKPTQTDQVNFSAMAQGQLEAGAQFILDIWAHTESQTEQVKMRANEMRRGDLKGTKQGVGIVQGSVLEVHLSLPGFEVADPVDLLTWNGEPVNVSFPVVAPKDCTEGSHLGTATIHSHGLMICKLHFQIEIGAGARAASEDLTVKTERPRTAFASYSSQNRNEVLGCLQGMQKVAPDLDVDIDVLSLRSGQDYREALERLIPAKDIFFLFWSKPASESKEVEWEWKMALSNKGLGFIDPVPLEDPCQVPPPAELSSLHFGDKWISFKNTTGQ